MAELAQPSERPFIIGVTGNIACGKTTVMHALNRLGAFTIDADAVYHQLIEPGSSLWQTLVEHFGRAIVDEDDQIDRRALGAIVFGDPAALKTLEALTHQPIRQEIHRRIELHHSGVVAIGAVKLIEGGLHHDCDSVWLVTCLPDQQMERLIARNRLTVEEVRQRIAAQPPVEPKLTIADVHIDNSGTVESTVAQVDRAWRALGLP
jgi:dephospho-CoA kinase